MEKERIIGYIVIGIILFLIGYIFGYFSGVTWALNWGVDKAIHFLDLKGLNVDVNNKIIAAALWQWKNNVGGFINCDYAPLYNNTRN